MIPRACSLFSPKHSTPSAPRTRPVKLRLERHKVPRREIQDCSLRSSNPADFPGLRIFPYRFLSQALKSFLGHWACRRERGKAIRRQQMAPTSLARTSGAAIGGLAVTSKGVEYALMAAGATVALIATVQSLGILASWV
jgi:hypothetical protein